MSPVTENKPNLFVRTIEKTQKILDTTSGLSRSAKLANAVIKFFAAVLKEIPEGLGNLSTTLGTITSGIGALGLIGCIYSLSHGFKNLSAELKAKNILVTVASVIDIYQFGSKLGIIPAAKIAAEIGKVSVLGVVANTLTLNLLQTALIVASAACTLTATSKDLIKAKKLMVKSATKIQKWSNRENILNTIKSGLANPEANPEAVIHAVNKIDILKQKYMDKITQGEIDLLEKNNALAAMDQNNPKIKKDLEIIKSEISTLTVKKARWIKYTVGGALDVEALEKNNQYKTERWNTEKTNATSQKKRSIFTIVVEVCKVVSIVFATVISFMFPVVGFGLSIAIASLSLISNTTGFMKFIQDKLYHKILPTPERPSLNQPQKI